MPLTVSFGQEKLLDGVTITPDEFYRRLSSENVFPTTTQPSPGAFSEIYKKLATRQRNPGRLHSSRSPAPTSRRSMPVPSWRARPRVEVIDSRLVIMGLGLVVMAAAEMAKKGQGIEAIIAMVKNHLPFVALMYFDTLKYLAKGGRRPGAGPARLTTVRQADSDAEDGVVTPLTRLRSMAAGADYLYNYVAGFPHIAELAVEHATTPHEADALTERLGALFPKERILRSTVSPVIGTYAGPNVLAVSLLEAA